MKTYKQFTAEVNKLVEESLVKAEENLLMDESVLELEEAEAELEFEELIEGIRRRIRVRAGKIRRTRTAGRKGYTIIKGRVRRIPANVLRRKSIKLKRAARRRKGKQASINRKTARSRRVGRRLKRR